MPADVKKKVYFNTHVYPEFIADLAKPITDRRYRAKIARVGRYSAKVEASMLYKH